MVKIRSVMDKILLLLFLLLPLLLSMFLLLLFFNAPWRCLRGGWCSLLNSDPHPMPFCLDDNLLLSGLKILFDETFPGHLDFSRFWMLIILDWSNKFYQYMNCSNCLTTSNEFSFPGFLTLPTAYVTGNPVECVVHPSLWNRTNLWDPLGIGLVDSKGQSLDDEYLEENYGAPINTVR